MEVAAAGGAENAGPVLRQPDGDTGRPPPPLRTAHPQNPPDLQPPPSGFVGNIQGNLT